MWTSSRSAPARQALGPIGLVAGWAPPFHFVFRAGARRQLAQFRSGG